jgi:tetratricopeptide (TPR) repeat protein
MALHKLGKTEDEAVELRELAEMSGEAATSFLRLIEIDTEASRWPGVLVNAQRALALNPFLPGPNAAQAAAAEALGQAAAAVRGYERLLLLQPSNPAQVRYKLATLLNPTDKPKAMHYLLDALVLAPRFREAQQLLLQLQAPVPAK